MAEPTLKDVLEAIAKLEAATKSELVAVRREVATKSVLLELRREVGANHAETTARLKRIEKQLDEVDEDLTGHMKIHREIEKDLELLKRRPPRTAARPTRRR
jgi:hypothetical protein